MVNGADVSLDQRSSVSRTHAASAASPPHEQLALGCRSSTTRAQVCVLGGGHAANAVRGFRLSIPVASSPRALLDENQNRNSTKTWRDRFRCILESFRPPAFVCGRVIRGMRARLANFASRDGGLPKAPSNNKIASLACGVKGGVRFRRRHLLRLR